ncbi:MAG: FeoA family protein [Saprospiraceae bacterium]
MSAKEAKVKDTHTALNLKLGEKAVICEIQKNHLSSRFMSLGILPGKVCTIVNEAPFGGAKILQFENHKIALRLEELAAIYVQKIIK